MLYELLDRVSSRRVWSQKIAQPRSHAEAPETSPTALALILLLSPDVSANNLKTLSVKGWPGRMTARTVGDVSGGSARLRATPGDSAPLAPNASAGDAVEFFR